MATHLTSHTPSPASSSNNEIPNPAAASASSNNEIPNPAAASASHGGVSPTRRLVGDHSISIPGDVQPPINDGAPSTTVRSSQDRTSDSSLPNLVHPTAKLLQRQDLWKVVLEFTISMTTGLLLQHQGLTNQQASAIVLALSLGFATLWNGMVLHDIYPRVASALEYIGVGIILVAFFGLVSYFLLPSLVWVCWLCCGLSVLPFLLRLVLPRAVEEASSTEQLRPDV